MSAGVVIAVGAVVVIVAVVVALVVARRPNDAVDSFRRQIDALSPEARRPVVDQVQSVTVRDDDGPASDQGASPSDAAASDGDGEASEPTTDTGDDEGGVRGT